NRAALLRAHEGPAGSTTDYRDRLASCCRDTPRSGALVRQRPNSCRACSDGRTAAAPVELGPGSQEVGDIGLGRVPAEAHPDRRADEIGAYPHRFQHMARPNLTRRASGTGANHDAVEIKRDDL